MCGIFGCVGNHDIYGVIIDSLKRLEYRGYDSAGVAMIDPLNFGLRVHREIGKPSEIEWPNFYGTTGIGHTRWATHGGVETRNAHPHLDCTGRIAVVHNGTLHNFRELRHDLERRGHRFSSDTDTEVIPHLIEDHSRELPFEEAVRKALLDLNGSYAIATVNSGEPYKMVAARNSSPLVLGIGHNGYYISSDIPTLSALTKLVVPLEPDEMAVLTKDGYRIRDVRTGQVVQREPFEIDIDWQDAQRDGHETFTEKEIFEQPDRLADCLTIPDEELYPIVEAIMNSSRVYISGIGTSFYAGLILRHLLARAGIPAEAIQSSEFHNDAVIRNGTSSIFFSQSGSTTDTNDAIEFYRNQRKKLGIRDGESLSIVNVMGSDMSRMVDHVAYTRSGPEIGVASTKNFLNQICLSLEIFFEIMKRKGIPTDSLYEQFLRMPEYVRAVIGQYGSERVWSDVIDRFGTSDPIFIGSGISYSVALEGALKLKELSYVNANAYVSGDLKHGPLALVESGTPVISINPTTKGKTYNGTRTNVEQAIARGAYSIAVGNDDGSPYHKLIQVPSVPYLLSPLITVVPLQLLAVYAAQSLGNDVDKPRNLAKSVTVE